MIAPLIIRQVLAHPTTGLLARLGLTCPFWISGLMKLGDWNAALGEMRYFGLEPAGQIAGAVITLQLAGSAAVILRVWTWLGAGALSVFTLAATLLVHDFWNAPPDEAFHQMTTFFEHLSIIAGLVLIAILADGRSQTQ